MALNCLVANRYAKLPSDLVTVAVGFSPRIDKNLIARRGATLESLITHKAHGNQPSLRDELIFAMNRGLKPTATVVPSLRGGIVISKSSLHRL